MRKERKLEFVFLGTVIWFFFQTLLYKINSSIIIHDIHLVSISIFNFNTMKKQ